MREKFLPYNKPTLGAAEVTAVTEVLNSLWLTTGPQAKCFESQFSEYVQAESALALNSCTAGLFLGLKALGVGPGDEVITTPLTFCATANVIEHLGATTVLADIHPETWLISPEDIEKKISPKTKVVLPVHFAGQVVDMEKITSLTQENGIQILEDAAHCLPSFYPSGTAVGGSDRLCSFSFYANKNITTGEGGMLTGPSQLVDKCRSLSLHGLDRDAWKRFSKEGSWRYDIHEPGFKFNMTDIQAAMGLVQLEKLPGMHERRRTISGWYREQLSEVAEVQMLPFQENSSFHIFPIVLRSDQISRDSLIEDMKGQNIGVSVHYLPIHQFSYYKDKYQWEDSDFPNASFVGNNCLTLPMYPELTEQDVTDVVVALKHCLCKEP